VDGGVVEVPREGGAPVGEVSEEVVEVGGSWGELPPGPSFDPNWEFTDPPRHYDPSVGGWASGSGPGVVDGGVVEVPREGGAPVGEVSEEVVEVGGSWGESPPGPPFDPHWLFTTPIPDDPAVGGWASGSGPGVVDGGVVEVPREGGAPGEVSEEVPVADEPRWSAEVEVPGEPTDPSGQPDLRSLLDRLAQWQERGSADRDGGRLADPDGPIGVPVASDAEISPVLSVDDTTAGDSSDGPTGPAVLGWAVSPRYTWEEIEYMRENGIPFERLPGSEMPPRSDDKDDRPRILSGSVTAEESPAALSDGVSAV
jgi:hypothetical protein